MRSPAAWAASSRERASAVLTARGFSLWTCLPAAIAANPTGTWAWGIVRLRTTSIPRSASNSSTEPAAESPNSRALSRARAGSRSAHDTILISSNFGAARRYAALILPQPIRPTFTGRMASPSLLIEAAGAALSLSCMTVPGHLIDLTQHQTGGTPCPHLVAPGMKDHFGCLPQSRQDVAVQRGKQGVRNQTPGP